MKKTILLLLLIAIFSLKLSAQSSNAAVYREFDRVYEKMKIYNSNFAKQQQQINALEYKLKSLNSQISSLKSENQQLRTELSDLKENQKAMLKEVRQAVEAAVSDLAKNTETQINKIVEQQNKISTQNNATDDNYVNYKVQPGATLSAIAKAYKCSVSEIKKLNKLKTNKIFVGQKLKIPVK